MSGRRTEIRYRLTVPHDGDLVIARDATITSATSTEMFALCETPEARGQALTLELARGTSSLVFRVVVADCAPVLVTGNVRFRLKLTVDGRNGHAWPSIPRRLSGQEWLGAMIVSVPSRLLDVSRTGCLLEIGRYMAAGTIGEIRIPTADRLLTEELRVTWSNRVEGAGSLCRLGAEFLRTRRLDESCLRRALQIVLDGRAQPRTVANGPLAWDAGHHGSLSKGERYERDDHTIRAGRRRAGPD